MVLLGCELVNDGGVIRLVRDSPTRFSDETLQMLNETNEVSPVTILGTRTSGYGQLDSLDWYHIVNDEYILYESGTNNVTFHSNYTTLTGDTFYIFEFSRNQAPTAHKRQLSQNYVLQMNLDRNGPLLALNESGTSVEIVIDKSTGAICEIPVDLSTELREVYDLGVDISDWCIGCHSDIAIILKTIKSCEDPVLATRVYHNQLVIGTPNGVWVYRISESLNAGKLIKYYTTKSPVIQIGPYHILCEDGSIWAVNHFYGHILDTKVDQIEPPHYLRRKQPVSGN